MLKSTWETARNDDTDGRFWPQTIEIQKLTSPHRAAINRRFGSSLYASDFRYLYEIMLFVVNFPKMNPQTGTHTWFQCDVPLQVIELEFRQYPVVPPKASPVARMAAPITITQIGTKSEVFPRIANTYNALKWQSPRSEN
jgi:hypothetical protein